MSDFKPMDIDGAMFQMRSSISERALCNVKANQGAAGQNVSDTEELEAVSRQFESLLLNMMIKEMRTTVPESGLFPESMAKDIFTAMLDEKYADAMAENGGIGLQRLLVDQFGDIKTGK